MCPLKVRYSEAGRSYFESTLPPLVRKQAKLTIALGVAFGLVMVVIPLLAFVMEDGGLLLSTVLLVALFAVFPTLLIIAGVLRLRVKPTLPDVVLEISEDEVIFAARRSAILLSPSRPERRWDRRATHAELLPATRTSKERVKFTCLMGGKSRTEFQAMEYLDTSAEAIIAAIEAA